ncbi:MULTISPECIES: LPXTG cell wall anchor domain-containing protein [Lactobacillaceae]|uniref:LPXTG cell wall anchor domain-containing protein n=1 Tax=Lactobacillaceae TaxID=33958 RepID=UPI0014568AF6|nr:LPXTG cell wall anchor domain-containing protein [Lactobacillus sp. HBUAS51381]NLR10180.1 LPXTG cell wall anchor domain-containing protein [Lactobacillus sp. HBUAS51381]
MSNGHGATITPGTDTAKQPDLVTPDKPQVTAINVTTHGQAAQLSPKKPQRVSGTRTPSSHQTTRTNLNVSSPAKQTLPQTNTHRMSPIAGLALLLGTLIGFGWSRKRNEH